jgi:hypothetical protein
MNPHPHSHRTGVREFVANLFGHHSHDTGASVDAALTASDGGMRALKISFAMLAVTATRHQWIGGAAG